MEYTQTETPVTDETYAFLNQQIRSFIQKVMGEGICFATASGAMLEWKEQFMKLHKTCQGNEVIMKQFTLHKWWERQAEKT